MTLRFLLVCEGSSDAALIPHISRLVIQNGQTDPQGIAWPGSRSLDQKILEGLVNFGSCDLLLVHRDADSLVETASSGPQKRANEIEVAVRDSGYSGPWVAIVPVRMTETWLLMDEEAIRQVSRRPHDNTPLGLPSPGQVESESDPKGCLEQALLTASGMSGRRLQKYKRDIPHLRRRLLEELPQGGPLQQVPSWVRFRDNLLAALSALGTQ